MIAKERVEVANEFPAKQGGDQRTRQELLDAAVRVFGEKSYPDATVDDIIREVGCARGTFYLYFKNKEDIFEHAADQAVREMYGSHLQISEVDVFERMKSRNRTYLETFGKHAGIVRNFFWMSAFNPRIAASHRGLAESFVARLRHHLEKNMREAESDNINMDVASLALAFMVEMFAYWWLAVKEVPEGESLDMEDVVSTLSSLVYRATYLEPTHSGKRLRRNNVGPTGEETDRS